MDLMVELKELALASRMKRLSEALMKDAAGFYEALGVDFQPRWFPVFYALTRRSPMPIGEIAHHLRLSHPAVGQVAEPMRRAGLVRCSRDRRDERKRLLSLTPAGRRLQRRLEPIWAEVRAAARELVDEAGVDLLADIAGVEAAVARHSVMDRVRRRLGMTARGELRIVDYRPAYKKCFRALNEEWLRDGFSIEPHDARVLEDPNGAILRHGGTILFALLDDEVVGTAALIRHPGEILELGKLAVASRARRRGIGTALARAVITRARDRGANAVYLRTSPRLKDAIRFYRRVGFRARATSPLPRAPYRRRSITMALTLEPRPRCRGREVSR
jgi:DNA-binding MarR family transcriptional regulator/GNAT superfamily N-acetyltransferase